MPAPVLVALYLATTLTPLVLAILQDKPARSIWDELSAGLGLTAFAILLVEFILSGRFRSISARIGIDTSMRFHQLLARTCAIFVLVHPFLYRAPIMNYPQPWDTTRLNTLGLDGATFATGLLAWVLLLALVLMAIFRDQLPFRYEGWRITHGLGAAIIAGLTAHHALGAGRYSGDDVLGYFWIGLVALALSTLAFIYLVEPLLEWRKPYAVTSVRRIAERTVEVVLEPQGDHRLNFRGGQFVWLNIARSPFVLHENPFSISSAPGRSPRLEFVIKEVGDFTRGLVHIAAGARAYLNGPHGNLILHGRTAPGIGLIAGGVGIAPLFSILRQMRDDGDRRPVVLLYGNRLQTQIVYEAELDALAREMPLTVVNVLSEPPEGWPGQTGVIDAASIAAAFTASDAHEWDYLVCGPPPMIDAVEDALIARGVKSGSILSERFNYD